MGGTNPYIKPAEYEAATQKFKITFVVHGTETTFEVSRECSFQSDRTAGQRAGYRVRQGSISTMRVVASVLARRHVIIREGLDSCSEATDDELDMLDEARGVELNSRLSCQCVPNGTKDLVVEVPNWNRNLIRKMIDRSVLEVQGCRISRPGDSTLRFWSTVR